jgi:ATP-dependent protease ClpP protease subunit
MITVARTAYLATLGRFRTLFARGQTEAKAPEAAMEDIGAPEYTVEGNTAEVRLYGEVVNHSIAGWYLPGEAVSDVGFARVVDKLKGKSIKVRVNSFGGDVFAGIAMANLVRELQLPVQVDSLAASIASVIAAASPDVTLSLGGVIMVHAPWSYAVGNAKAMRAEANILDQITEAMLDIYSSRKGLDRKAWAAALVGPDGQDGTWYIGEQALEAGIVDRYETGALPEAKRAALIAARKDAASYNAVALPKNLETLEATAPDVPKTETAASGTPSVESLKPGVRVSHRPGGFYLPRQ